MRDICVPWVPQRRIWLRSEIMGLTLFCQAKESGCQADPAPKGLRFPEPRWSSWMYPAPCTAAWAGLRHRPNNRTPPERERATPKAFVFKKTATEDSKEMKHNVQRMKHVCMDGSELCHLGNAGRCKDQKEGIHSSQCRVPRAFIYLAFSLSRASLPSC